MSTTVHDRLHKVTVSVNQATHVTDPAKPHLTLCGRVWHFQCDHGTEHYCRLCQYKLARILWPQP